MKKTATALLVLLFAAACLGTSAREDVLWPRVKTAWPAVRSDIESGGTPSPNTAVTMGKVNMAVDADDWRRLWGLDWALIDRAARAGIQARVDAGEISPGVAVSLRERVNQFSAAMQELVNP